MRGWKIADYSQSCLIGSMQSAALVLDAVDGATDAMELQIAVEVRQEKTFFAAFTEVCGSSQAS